MSDLLIIQSIGDDPNDRFIPYMELQEPVHRDYAARCGADYEYFIGRKDLSCNPTWNRVPMILEAFERGYRKVFWMDADVLVVKPDENVFDGTPDDVPFVMTRVDGAHVDMPWMFDPDVRNFGLCGAFQSPPSTRRCALEREDIDSALRHQQLMGTKSFHVGPHCDGEGEWPQWDVYNDGVLMVNRTLHADLALREVWQSRHQPFRPWHVPGMPELDWILDEVFYRPEWVERLHDRWNWQRPGMCERDEAAILAWHGETSQRRWSEFKAAYDEHYGGGSPSR